MRLKDDDDELYELSISRKEFNDICRPLIMRSVEIAGRTLKNSDCTAGQIDEVSIIKVSELHLT